MNILTCWTCADQATQPVLRQADDGVDITLTIGVWTPLDVMPKPSIRAKYRHAGQWHDLQLMPAEVTLSCLEKQEKLQKSDKPQRPERLEKPGRLEKPRKLDEYDVLELSARTTDIRNALRGDSALRFYQVHLPTLPIGAPLRFEAAVALPGLGLAASSGMRALWAVAPRFGYDEVQMSRVSKKIEPLLDPLPGEDLVLEQDLPEHQWGVLLVKQPQDGFAHVRLDMLRTDALDGPAILPVQIGLDDGPMIDVSSAPTAPETDQGLADFVAHVIDRSTDSIILSVPRPNDRPLRKVTIRTPAAGTAPADEWCWMSGEVDEDFGYRPVALLLLQYSIQGFNDLFAAPDPDYKPPRNFIEIAFADEQAKYSGRPQTPENGIPDGYRYAFDAQRDYRVKTHWAFNGGLLTLFKHGLPDDEFARLTEQIRGGLLSPANAGFGAHRPPYYKYETHLKEIELADQMIRSLLPGRPNGIYYPDQRLYLATDAEVAAYRALKERGKLEYLVLDRSTVAARAAGIEVCLFGEGHPTGDEGNYLWTETRTGLTLLLIEDQLRNELLNAQPDEVSKGQVGYALRRRFMRATRFDKNHPSKIYIYGDDLDHSCGDGWFDGSPISYTRGYRAALRWISTHPWVRAWAVDEPEFEPNLYRSEDELTVSSAICPTVDPRGAESYDMRGRKIHFNSWYQAWANTRSPWLDRSLKELSDRLETALIEWLPQYSKTELYELAWMYFLACTHESMWSKQPLDHPNDDDQEWEPEDFVISESTQQRNAWVYLNACAWATWASSEVGADRNQTFALTGGRSNPGKQVAGPLLDVLDKTSSAGPYWLNPHPDSDRGGYWDQDCLATIVLYNRHACVVIDRNGGRITNIFCQVGDRAVSISGTFKSHQFLTVDRGQRQIPCDGVRIQNTVFTPNHAYVGADVVQSAPYLGSYTDQRGVPHTPQASWYPDNFNVYDCEIETSRSHLWVACTYQPGRRQPIALPVAEQEFLDLCGADGASRRQADSANEVVWHVGPGFSKRFELRDDVLRVSYLGVPAGHTVSNEFAVDLRDAVLRGGRQTKSAAPGQLTLHSARNIAVTVRLGDNCAFVEAATALTAPARPVSAVVEYGALHRVLTDDLRIVCEDGGDFEYEILLPI